MTTYLRRTARASRVSRRRLRAASPELAHEILPLSNVPGPQQVSPGPVRVGSFEGISLHGAVDVAGNVKEWCLNEAEPGRRLALGGAWDEPEYMFHTRDSRDAFDRSPNLGFRCARYGRDRLPREALAAVPEPPRTYDNLAPVADGTFEVYRGIYAYDAAPLEARVEATEEDPGGSWRLEKVSYVGPDGAERLPAYLFMPVGSTPPYQAVMFFPGSSATTVRSSRDVVPGPAVAFLLKSGRAVLYPIYKGTYERGTAASPLEHRPSMAASFRDLYVTLSKEVRRGVDYLQSRPDIDADRIGYFGLSWGACIAPLSLSLDTRMRAAVLVSGGLLWSSVRPEVDTIHFLPRVTAPVLMLNGERDAFYPPRSQRAMFDLLGTPPGRKRHVVFPGAGHAVPRNPFIAETLVWFDRYLGTTATATRGRQSETLRSANVARGA